jgi:hypothetical protein
MFDLIQVPSTVATVDITAPIQMRGRIYTVGLQRRRDIWVVGVVIAIGLNG